MKKKVLFTVLTILLMSVLGVSVFGFYRLESKRVADEKAARATTTTLPFNREGTTTTTQAIETSSTSSTNSSTTTTTINRGTSTTTTTASVTGDSTTTTTSSTTALKADDGTTDCDDLELLDYWRNARVENIEEFISIIPRTRRWIVTCGSLHPIQAIELRDWVRVRLSL